MNNKFEVNSQRKRNTITFCVQKNPTSNVCYALKWFSYIIEIDLVCLTVRLHFTSQKQRSMCMHEWFIYIYILTCVFVGCFRHRRTVIFSPVLHVCTV